MAKSDIDLAKLFKAVTNALSENQSSLNEADSFNSNHGDNMVEIFNTITKAVGKKKKSDAGTALAFASEALKKKHSSGSSQVYAEGLSRAAEAFKSKQVTPENAFGLIQALLGGGGAPAAEASGGDILASLLSGLTGEQQADLAALEGVNFDDLISTGMAFLQAQGGGEGAIESLIQAVISGGALGGSSHRAKSGQLIGNTLMKLLGVLGR